MKTSVIIPNFNGLEYLKNCISCLRKCEGASFAIIVVDNGSTDGSVKWIKEEAGEVMLISLPDNTGFSYAVNRGIEAAETEYVILLNNDTRVHKDFVRSLEDRIESDKNLFSVSAKMLCMSNPDIIDGCGDNYSALGWAYAIDKGKKSRDTSNQYKEVFSACAGAAIYSRDVLLQIGLFDETHFAYLEDVDLGYRARLFGYKNAFEPYAICLHAGSAVSGSRHNKFKVSLSSRNSIYLIWKNMPLWQIVINLPFLLIGYGIKALFFILKGLGATYLLGLMEGFKLCKDKANKNKRISFTYKKQINAIKIQGLLYKGAISRFL